MGAEHDTVGILTDAESLIDAREFPTALWRLRLAAGNIQPDASNAAWLLERIRDAAASVAWTDPRYANEAQAVWDIAIRRGAEFGLPAENWPATIPRRKQAGVSVPRPWDDEAWYFVAADVVADVAIAASAISAVVALVVAFKGSETSYGHDGGVFVLNLLAGLFVAVLWIGVAAALNLLVHIARAQRTAAARP